MLPNMCKSVILDLSDMDIRSEVADHHTNVQTMIHNRYDIMIMKSNATTNLSFWDIILLVGTNQICAQAFKMKKKKPAEKKKIKTPEKLADRYADTKSVRSFFFSLNFVNTEMSHLQTVINAIFPSKINLQVRTWRVSC